MSADILLKIINLSKIYETKKEIIKALDGVNLTIYKGEIIALLGPNGAGKTTLSSILATLHPPTKGEILYNGTSIYKDILGFRKLISFCPQKPNLDPYLNVEDNLIFSGRYHLMPENKIKEKVTELMEQLSILRYAKFDIDHLSGGTERRVLIARALMHNPNIIILDEPTVGLDPEIRIQLWKLIQSLKDKGITIIITTHYLEEAENIADRVCILKKGKIVLTEHVSSLMEKHKKETLQEVFLSLMQEQNDEFEY